MRVLVFVSDRLISMRLNPCDSHASKKYFKNRFHIINQHCLKVILVVLGLLDLLFGAAHSWHLRVLVPHFKYNNLTNVPILTLFSEVLKNKKRKDLREKVGVSLAGSCLSSHCLKINKFKLTCSLLSQELGLYSIINVLQTSLTILSRFNRILAAT